VLKFLKHWLSSAPYITSGLQSNTAFIETITEFAKSSKDISRFLLPVVKTTFRNHFAASGKKSNSLNGSTPLLNSTSSTSSLSSNSVSGDNTLAQDVTTMAPAGVEGGQGTDDTVSLFHHGGSVNILEQPANEFAKQIALINHQLFTRLNLMECLKKAFTVPETSPTFTALTNKFNEVRYSLDC
jgi:hypothetical protein